MHHCAASLLMRRPGGDNECAGSPLLKELFQHISNKGWPLAKLKGRGSWFGEMHAHECPPPAHGGVSSCASSKLPTHPAQGAFLVFKFPS